MNEEPESQTPLNAWTRVFGNKIKSKGIIPLPVALFICRVPLRLKAQHYQLLLYISSKFRGAAPPTLHIHQIAKDLGRTDQGVRQLIRELAKKGLITKLFLRKGTYVITFVPMRETLERLIDTTNNSN